MAGWADALIPLEIASGPPQAKKSARYTTVDITLRFTPSPRLAAGGWGPGGKLVVADGEDWGLGSAAAGRLQPAGREILGLA